jgi:hypothetical protein
MNLEIDEFEIEGWEIVDSPFNSSVLLKKIDDRDVVQEAIISFDDEIIKKDRINAFWFDVKVDTKDDNKFNMHKLYFSIEDKDFEFLAFAFDVTNELAFESFLYYLEPMSSKELNLIYNKNSHLIKKYYDWFYEKIKTHPLYRLHFLHSEVPFKHSYHLKQIMDKTKRLN